MFSCIVLLHCSCQVKLFLELSELKEDLFVQVYPPVEDAQEDLKALGLQGRLHRVQQALVLDQPLLDFASLEGQLSLVGLGHRRTSLKQLLVVVLVAGLADQPLALMEDVVQLVAVNAARACPGAAGRRLLAELVQLVEGFRVGLAHALELDSESVVKVQQAFV